MARDSFIKFHLEQAERYSRALSDPMYVSEYSARFLAQNITYHRSMADWYMAEPERPKEEFNDEVQEEGIRATIAAEKRVVEEVSTESVGVREGTHDIQSSLQEVSRGREGTREDTDDSEGSNSNTDDAERTVT